MLTDSSGLLTIKETLCVECIVVLFAFVSGVWMQFSCIIKDQHKIVMCVPGKVVHDVQDQ